MIGKIKTLKHFKANTKDLEGQGFEKPRIKFKKEFTENGNVSYLEYYDNFGKLKLYTKNDFDKNGYKYKSITEDYTMHSKSIDYAVFDTLIGKRISTHGVFNDSILLDVFLDYDTMGNVIKQTSVKHGDTLSNQLEYKYDKEGRIILKTQLDNDKNVEYKNEFRYDSKGNLTESINKSRFVGELKSIYKYDSKNRIEKISEFKSGQIERETYFDKFYNQILVKNYHENSLQREMSFKYKFDKKGNWIQRDASVKEYFGSKKQISVYRETRKIEYYE
ncbi:MAG: hypothetical protein PVH88_24320 [Ignavibacteria bacterium]